MASVEELLGHSRQWEASLMKIAFESFSKFIRGMQKSLEKKISIVVANINQFMKTKPTKSAMLLFLPSQSNRLKELKEKMLEASILEKNHLQTLQLRLEHSSVPARLANKEIAQPWSEWYDIRLSRIIMDYLLRMEYHQTAEMLFKTEKLENLIDKQIYTTMSKIILSLKQKNCQQALKWCGENRTRLNKQKSFLELHLHLQEFLIIMSKSKLKAIAYAQKWIKPFMSEKCKEIQHVMGALAYPTIKKSPYQHLTSQARWEELIIQFKEASARIYGLPLPAMISVDFQAGLTLLKTENCFKEEEKLLNCPVCQPPFDILSRELPFSRRNNSTLICKISGKLMDDNNPPLAFPNGFVYSKEALDSMAEKHNGNVVCPRSGVKCKQSELKKIFIT